MGKIPSNAPHAGRAGNATNHMDEVPIPGRGGAAQAGQGGAPGALNGIQPVNRTAPPQPVRNAPARERSDFDEVHGVIPTPRQIRLMAQYAPADMSQNPPPQAHRFVKNDETGTIQPAAQAAQMQPAAQAAQMQPAAQAAQMQPAARAAQLQPAAQAAQMRPEDMRPEQPPLEIVNAVFRDDIADMEAQDLAPLLDDQPLMYQLERFLDDTDWFGTVVFNDNIGVGVNTESRYIALPERLMDPDIADLHAALRAVVNLPPLQA